MNKVMGVVSDWWWSRRTQLIVWGTCGIILVAFNILQITDII